MATFTNKTKHTANFTNNKKSGIVLWDDDRVDWDDDLFSWDSLGDVFTNKTKHIATFTNKTKN